MDEYDVGEAFAAIEDELIKSMIRNMERHRAEETEEGIEWTQWQVEQLKALEKYKLENQKRYAKKFKDINAKIDDLIRAAHSAGNMEQEIEILEAIKKGFKGYRRSSSTMSAKFFRLNERKLDALIKATTDDLKKAEIAVLRMSNDQYRKAVFNAQVYANTGAGTYEKAVDMATKNLRAAGLNCVEYANGARHTLSDYADMAIRTASKRAYLQGEGEKRQEWGISTVIMNKRGNPCPKCLPWVGKVLIDDVWSGGSAEDGPYPLMSTAIAAGLYHPRCKDGHTTYFEGISTLPDDRFTRKEIREIVEENRKETERQYSDRQAEKFDRMTKYSMDPENQKRYAARREEWKKRQDNRNVESVNREATDKLLQAYDDRRKHFSLNLASASELKSNALNPVTADYSGISGRAAKEFSGVIEELSEQYYTGLTKIRVAEKKETFGAQFFATTQHKNSVGVKELIINPHKMADFDSMVERISVLSKKGYCIKMPQDKLGAYIPTHEFAHSLIDMESPLKNYIGMDNRQSTKIRKEIKEIYNEYIKEISDMETKIQRLKKDKAFFDLNTDLKEQFAAFKRLEDAQNELAQIRISIYSTQNADEFMAEAFAQAKLGTEQSRYSERVTTVLDKYFKKEMELEFSPRKAENGTFSVNWSKVQSPEYRKKLEKLSDNPKVIDSIEIRSKWALHNRNGLKTEELYAVSLDTGKEIGSVLGQQIESGVRRTHEFTKRLNAADKEKIKVLLIHNHPQSYPPSIADINALLKNKYASGITLGHNGDIYYYTRPKKEIPQFDFDVALRRYKGYTDITAMEKALAYLQDEYGFTIQKL